MASPAWSTPHQILTHALASSIINLHNQSGDGLDYVFGPPSLTILECLSLHGPLSLDSRADHDGRTVG
jgi:hypothetical protein